ncbi:MAG: ribosome-associated translation inhibitor RaiA [Candidatus Eisenbacteria bacterium]|nr:ribosome-associated translation inhibitor RaiA [Candidatus Eisenbacteria bacterium]
MRLQITTRHYELPADLKSLAEERLTRLKRFFDQIMDIGLVLSTEKHRNHAEITLRVGGHDWAASAEAADMRSAIDDAAAKIEIQLKKYKDRLTDKKGRTHLGEAMADEVAEAESGVVEFEEES